MHDAFNDIGSSKWNWYAYISFGYVQYPFIVLIPDVQIIALGLFIWYMADAGIKGVFKVTGRGQCKIYNIGMITGEGLYVQS